MAVAVNAQDHQRIDQVPITNSEYVFEEPKRIRLITADNAIHTLALFALSICFAKLAQQLSVDSSLEMPLFVWAMIGGIIVRQISIHIFKHNIFDRSIDVFGNTTLSLYLAMVLISLKLRQLSNLALPIMILLIMQSIAMWLFVIYISFKFMGKNYNSALLSAGLCGFGMGATPNAIANMQSISRHYGPSHKAFLLVPIVAFFSDITNAIVIQAFLKIFT